MEIRKIYGVGHFWNFDQISMIIVARALTVEWDHSFSWAWRDRGSHWTVLTQLKTKCMVKKNDSHLLRGNRQHFQKFFLRPRFQWPRYLWIRRKIYLLGSVLVETPSTINLSISFFACCHWSSYAEYLRIFHIEVRHITWIKYERGCTREFYTWALDGIG